MRVFTTNRGIHAAVATAVLSIAASTLFTVSACTAPPDDVYIGAPDYIVGRQAIELAVEEINAGGGINGAQLKVEFASALRWQTKVHQAVSIADSLSDNPKVIAVVGHDTSLDSLPAAHVYNRKGTVQIVPSSSNPLITDIGPWIFRLSVDDEQQGAFLAGIARQKLDFDKIAVLFVNNDYGKMLAHSFIESFERAGGRIGFTGFYAEEDVETVDRMVTRVIKSDLRQVFFIGIHSALLRILQRFNEAGIEAVILSSDMAFIVGLVDQFLENVGNCRLYASSFYNPLCETPHVVRFREAFRKRYGREPEPNDALFYDAVKLIAQGVANAGADRQALRDYLAGIGDKTPPFEGVSGRISFSGKEGGRRLVTVLSFEEGLSVFETKIVPSEQHGR